MDLRGLQPDSEAVGPYSPNEALAAEREARQREAELVRLRAELEEMNTQAREDALDRVPPATVRAYRQVYGRDPKGWPPT